MKKFFWRIVIPALVAVLAAISLTGCGNSDKAVLRVYNWAEYMDPEVITMFEEETGIEVFYQVYDTNESMYNQIKNMSGYSYDIIFPSDYMVKKMANEGLLAELNFDNIPNYSNIDEKYDKMAYDKKRLYSVPYVGGTVCLAYDKTKVDESDVNTWAVLWNEKYNQQIFMMDSERDSIAVALKYLGYSLNTKNMTELNEAKEILKNQKQYLLDYTVEDVKDKMVNGEGAIALLWSCDVTFIAAQNENIAFTIPDEGTNLWWDAVCVLKDAKYKTEAEQFINFLCRPDIALMNAEYLESTTPNKEAYKMLDESIKNNPVIYPPDDMLAKSEVFEDLSDYASVYSSIWSEVTGE